jgi:hypothetical protein
MLVKYFSSPLPVWTGLRLCLFARFGCSCYWLDSCGPLGLQLRPSLYPPSLLLVPTGGAHVCVYGLLAALVAALCCLLLVIGRADTRLVVLLLNRLPILLSSPVVPLVING